MTAAADIPLGDGGRRHDPLCGQDCTCSSVCDDVVCNCDLIARVREDEEDQWLPRYNAAEQRGYDAGERNGYAAALRDAVEVVEDRIEDLATCNKDDECHTLARGAALALSDIQALGGER